jgi:hypothetical protein
MTQAKHTPGQWSYCEDETSPGYFLVKSGNTNICIMQQKNSDMGMKTDPTRKQCIANARLIAAAPETAAERDRLKAINAELLVALELLIKSHDASCTGEECKIYGIDLARYIVAKAKESA